MLGKLLMRVFQSYSSMFHAILWLTAIWKPITLQRDRICICAETACWTKSQKSLFDIFKYGSINLWFNKSEIDLLCFEIWEMDVTSFKIKSVEWMLLFSFLFSNEFFIPSVFVCESCVSRGSFSSLSNAEDCTSCDGCVSITPGVLFSHQSLRSWNRRSLYYADRAGQGRPLKLWRYITALFFCTSCCKPLFSIPWVNDLQSKSPLFL